MVTTITSKQTLLYNVCKLKIMKIVDGKKNLLTRKIVESFMRIRLTVSGVHLITTNKMLNK